MLFFFMVNVKVKPNTCHVRVIGISSHLLSENDGQPPASLLADAMLLSVCTSIDNKRISVGLPDVNMWNSSVYYP